MATGNFAPMQLGMPLIVGRTFEQAAKAYAEEMEAELTEEQFYDWVQEDDFEDASFLAKEFSENLTFHTVTVRGGYYTGFQFYVEEAQNAEDIEEISNEDAHYYFDLCRSKAIERAQGERRKIYRWLMGLKKRGFNELGIMARFSNGETLYCFK